MNLKILYLAPDVLISGSHGGSSHVAEATKSLARMGNKVYLLRRANFFNFQKKGNLWIIGLPVIDVPFFRSFTYVIYTILTTIFCSMLLNIDLVYERGRIFGGFGVLLAKLFRKKSVYEFNEPFISLLLVNNVLKEDSFYFKVINNLHNAVIGNATLTTITNENMKTDVKEGNTLLIWWGTNPEVFKPNIKCDDIIERFNLKKGKTFLYGGSFSEWHSCETMIEIIKRLVKDDKVIKLIMIGKGSKLNKCKRKVKENNLRNNVIFLNKINHNEMPRFINASDFCFALFDRNYKPFRKFSFFYSPIKIHEYKACGKPVIASDFGNLNELVKDNINGISVNEQNTDDIVKRTKALIKNKILIEKVSKNNRKEIIDKYNWDVINKTVLNKLSSFK